MILLWISIPPKNSGDWLYTIVFLVKLKIMKDYIIQY